MHFLLPPPTPDTRASLCRHFVSLVSLLFSSFGNLWPRCSRAPSKTTIYHQNRVRTCVGWYGTIPRPVVGWFGFLPWHWACFSAQRSTAPSLPPTSHSVCKGRSLKLCDYIYIHIYIFIKLDDFLAPVNLFFLFYWKTTFSSCEVSGVGTCVHLPPILSSIV